MSGKHFALLLLVVTLMAGVTVAAMTFLPIEAAWLVLLAMVAAYALRRWQR